ncbi:MAG TPA: beta-propeller fold lactonase family protein [Terracidiphilus sp.]|jgi:6-phosphogluconolactonase (cycloisomerase 2 family)
MKFSKLSQLFLVSVIGLLVATLLTACQLVTIDYIYLAESSSSTPDGQIQSFAVDSQSGALRTGTTAVDTGGPSPVAIAVSADYANLYVANQGNNSVVHFSIASTGVLTKKDSVTLAAAPVALSVNAAGTFLFVASGTTSATLTAYPLSSGAIGAAVAQEPLTLPSPTNAGDTLVPTGVVALANNNAVYVTLYDQSAYNPGGTTSSTANPGWVFGFSVGTGGALTAAGGSPYRAGVKPSAAAADPTSRFLYVTDFASNQLVGYSIQSNGILSFLINGPFKTGNEPSSIVIDPRGRYIYVANSLDSTVSAYLIDLATGTPSSAVNVTGSSVNSTDTEPVSITVDPAIGRFVYTANYLGNSVSGFRLDPNSGALTAAQATPFPTNGPKPTAIACIPHGNHSLQVTTP